MSQSQIMISSDETVGPVNPDVTYMFVKQCISRARRAVRDNMCMPYQRVIMYLANRETELESELARCVANVGGLAIIEKRRPTSADRYYEAASAILEDEGPLAGNCDDNAHELGALISQWIERKRDNWEPS